MDAWQKSLQHCITTPEQLARYFPVDPAVLAPVVQRYPLCITPHYFQLIREPGDPIWRQCVPDPLELADDGQEEDPLNEEHLSPVPHLVHRYPDRALFLVSGRCAGYCRFCTRKRKVGRAAMAATMDDIHAAITYIAQTSAIHDVILSGGEPLLLPDMVLEELLSALRRIPHVDIIRIGSRIPVTLPERITDNLCNMLRRFHPVYLNTHFNHPREITPEAETACNRLAAAGIQLGNQTVLLRGVNDDTEVLRELFRALLKIRVRPYYLHHMDLVKGTGHFRTDIATGLSIIRQLRGTLSGLGIPHYVVDLPGGRGKVPLNPEYLREVHNQFILTAPTGEQIIFPEVT